MQNLNWCVEKYFQNQGSVLSPGRWFFSLKTFGLLSRRDRAWTYSPFLQREEPPSSWEGTTVDTMIWMSENPHRLPTEHLGNLRPLVIDIDIDFCLQKLNWTSVPISQLSAEYLHGSKKSVHFQTDLPSPPASAQQQVPAFGLWPSCMSSQYQWPNTRRELPPSYTCHIILILI